MNVPCKTVAPEIPFNIVMKILSDFFQDTQSQKIKKGSYEWWYFDAMSEDGFTVVIIFYEGNPFSKRYITDLKKYNYIPASDYPAISISIYKDEKPIFYSFEEVSPKNAFYSSSKPEGKVGKNNFKGDKNNNGLSYTIHLNQHTLSGDSVTGMLKFDCNTINAEVTHSPDDTSSDHSWNLVAPRCTVKGTLTINGYEKRDILFTGTGYHDHNIGLEPMKDSFREWYWGRYHLQNFTFIYYIMKKKNGWDKKAWLFSKNGVAEEIGNSIVLGNEQYNPFGLKSARKLKILHRDTELVLQKDRVIDNGPFYQRFEGRVLLKHEGRMEQSRGVSEYIYPSGIYNRLFWPLVNMRIRYPGKSHWVQRSPVLFRWTW